MRNKYLNVLFFIGLIVILIVINNTAAKDIIRVSVLDVSEGVLSSVNFFFSNFTSGLSKIKESVTVYKEKERLEIEVADLKSKLIQFNEVKSENERLRALLQFQSQNDLNGVSAQVIGRDMSAFSDFIILNRGKQDGVDVGTVIISHQGLVGHVVSAGQSHARAILLSDTKARVSAIVQETREAGIIEGTPTGFLKLRHLEISSSVKVGDIVVTSGFGDIYPKGIPVGRIEVISNDHNNMSVFALVKPYVDFSTIEEIVCLKSK
jgi:rod shape-determining protein MreC